MTTDNWIAIGGLVTAAASVVVAFLAFRQSILQRTTLTKPQLFPSSIDIPVIHELGEIFSFSPKDEKFNNNFLIPIKNVGLGTALNLKYSWDFDYINTLTACGFSQVAKHHLTTKFSDTRASKIGKTFYFKGKESSDFLYFSLSNNQRFKSHSIKKVATELEYIIPITQDDSPNFLLLPSLIAISFIEKIEKTIDLPYKMMAECECAVLYLTYEDISGRKLTSRFSCTFRLTRFNSNGENGPESVYILKLNRL